MYWRLRVADRHFGVFIGFALLSLCLHYRGVDEDQPLTILAARVGLVDAGVVGSYVIADFSLLVEMTDPAFDPVFDFLSARPYSIVGDEVQPSESKEGAWARVMHFALHDDEGGTSDPFDDLLFLDGTR